jgi:predicted naringenin-chalcone synthase
VALAGFWVVHPGGRKVIDNVQKHFSMTDAQLRKKIQFTAWSRV